MIRDYAEQLKIPVFYTHCVGYYSHFSLLLPPAFPIIDTHPDPASTTDLRLLKPWPQLSKFAKEKTSNLSGLSAHDLGHIPYVLLLLHFLDEWRSSHDGAVPSTYQEKTAFRDMVREAGPVDEENFAEAVGAVLKSLNPSTACSSALAVLNAPEAQNLTPTSASFWYIAHAIYQFYESHGELPLPGAVPDMKAQSSDYITLQNIYKSRARHDFSTVLSTVRELEKKIGKAETELIDEKEVEAFCKGAAHIKLVRGRPFLIPRPQQRLQADKGTAKAAVEAMNLALAMGDNGVFLWIAFLAWDSFAGAHELDGLGGAQRAPGMRDGEVDADAEKMVSIAHTIVDDLINDAGTFIEEPEYGSIKEEVATICRELSVFSFPRNRVLWLLQALTRATTGLVRAARNCTTSPR